MFSKPGKAVKPGLFRYLVKTFELGRCPVCARPGTGGRFGLCASCLNKLDFPEHRACPMCGRPMPTGETLCHDCRLDPKPWGRAYCVGPYSGLLRDMILDFKFSGQLGLGRILAHMAADAVKPGKGLLVPVPLHTARLRRRGFNQCLELARRVSKLREIPFANALTRVKNTRPQMELTKTERRQNIKSAFSADPGKILGQRVILVDDIMTTGSTLKECAQELKKEGAEKIDILILSRA